MNVDTIAVFLFFPSLASLFHLWMAVHSLYAIGKSKTNLKKIGKSIKLWSKFLLLYPLEPKLSHHRKAIILRRLYYFVLIAFLICIFLLIFTMLFPPVICALFYCVALKLIVLDIPIGITAFIMSKHGKNGGVVWRWEE